MTPSRPLTPEVLIPKMGDILVEKGLITRQQLDEALERQKELRGRGEPAPLMGQLLVEMGVLERPQLDQAVTEQILQLRAALEANNRDLERRVRERTAELQAALSKLEELNQLKANFLANVSHELRTPMTHIKGYLDLLIAGDLGPLNAEHLNALNTMLRAASRLERLIEDLILFSAAEENQIHLEMLDFNLSQLCQLVLDQAEPAAQKRKVRLELDAIDRLPPAHGDQEKISWVIQQLIDNAIKFSPAGAVIKVQILHLHDQVRCTIIDNGIGIPVDRIAEIFEPFHQLDGSSTRRYGGTGLGLALVKKIIEAHGSTIEVQSQVGVGSQFSFGLKAGKAPS